MPRTKKPDRDGVSLRRDGYYISFTDYQGRRKQKKLRGCVSKTEAKRLRNLELARVSEQRASGKPSATEETFSQVIPKYLEFQKASLTPGGYNRTLGIVNKHLLPIFGALQLARIRRPDIINFVTRRKGEVAGATVIRELNVLKHIFNWSIDQEKIAESPCGVGRFAVKGPKAAPERLRYLSPAELRLVLDACPEWLRPIVALLCLTGMRRSELLGLRWLDVDRAGCRFLLPISKNGDRRIVPLNGLALKVLDTLPRETVKPTDTIFRGVTPDNVSLTFLRSCRRAGIADFRLHDLRHSFASQIAMAGGDIRLIGELLGHKDLRMTKRYTQLSSAFLADASRRLDGVFGAELESLPMLNGKSHDGRTIEHENESKQVRASAS